MAARKNKASSVADSIKALMDAMQDQVLPRADNLRKEGWISASDYAEATGRNRQNSKVMLDKVENIEKQQARGERGLVTMYRMKK